MGDLLRGSSDEEEDDLEFRINHQYATNYDKWRQKEELVKLKARYGEEINDLSGSSSSSESEDENIEANPSMEKDFFKTLSCLMSQDPKIYDQNVTFFKSPENEGNAVEKKKKKEKPVYLKDYERNVILEKGGIFTDEEDSDNPKVENGRASPTYVEEQKQIIKSFKTALDDSDDDEEDGTNLLKEKKKTDKELKQEEADYLEWLKGNKDSLNDEAQDDMKYLRDFWNNPKLDSDEAFLRDYILNKKYLDDEDKDRIPAYDEVAHDSEELSEDEKTLKQQEEFEHKYNFRFEEPDAAFIKHYPRTMSDTLRKKDNKRKLQREERKSRKLQEKEQKQEELKRLKALKRKEILDKIEKLKQITGNTNVGFDDDDVEGDFDPNAHDEKMRRIFDDGYYQVEDVEKPEFPNDEEWNEYEEEDWDNWTRQDHEHNDNDGPHCEDPEFNMDADYDPRKQFESEMLDSTKTRKRKRKSRFAEAMSKSKPLFDPEEDGTFDSYLDEYYKLDYEDIIGDLPCRFKYRKVISNDFGLSAEEILAADDKELNKWCSLKKAYQYRTKEQEEYDVHAYRVKAQNENKKKKILTSVYAEPREEETVTKKRKRNSGQKESPDDENGIENVSWKKKPRVVDVDGEARTFAVDQGVKKRDTERVGHTDNVQHDTRNSKQRKKKKVKNKASQGPPKDKQNLSDDRLRAYGLNPKKFKRHKFYNEKK